MTSVGLDLPEIEPDFVTSLRNGPMKSYLEED